MVNVTVLVHEDIPVFLLEIMPVEFDLHTALQQGPLDLNALHALSSSVRKCTDTVPMLSSTCKQTSLSSSPVSLKRKRRQGYVSVLSIWRMSWWWQTYVSNKCTPLSIDHRVGARLPNYVRVHTELFSRNKEDLAEKFWSRHMPGLCPS